jgi:CRP/FNR family transcriptional regulator, cyclic AMP receptor protein
MSGFFAKKARRKKRLARMPRLQAAASDLWPFTTHYFLPGSWLGEGPIITDRPRMIGLTAARETELLHVALPGLRELLSREPAFWR